MARPVNPTESTMRSVIFPDPLWSALSALAQAQSLSVSDLVRRGARELLERESEPKKSRRKVGWSP